MKPLQDKSVILTGAGGGIGQAAALRLAEAGARLVLTDVRDEPLHACRERILAAGGNAVALAGDVTREADVAACVAAAKSTYGRLDVLVNNCGGTGPRDQNVHQMDAEVWDFTFAVNARGPMLYCKHAIPLMLEAGGGAIVNVASGSALTGQLGTPAYAAAKAALISLTRSVATLYGRDGIRCNAIAPGLIMHDRLATRLPEAFVKMDADNLLVPQPGTPDDIAAAMIYLASEQSRFVNAQVLAVDGGLLSHTPFYAQLRAPAG